MCDLPCPRVRHEDHHARGKPGRLGLQRAQRRPRAKLGRAADTFTMDRSLVKGRGPAHACRSGGGIRDLRRACAQKPHRLRTPAGRAPVRCTPPTKPRQAHRGIGTPAMISRLMLPARLRSRKARLSHATNELSTDGPGDSFRPKRPQRMLRDRVLSRSDCSGYFSLSRPTITSAVN
jgi:hypothetical protein